MKPKKNGVRLAKPVRAYGWKDLRDGLDADCIIANEPDKDGRFNGDSGYVPVEIREVGWRHPQAEKKRAV